MFGGQQIRGRGNGNSVRCVVVGNGTCGTLSFQRNRPKVKVYEVRKNAAHYKALGIILSFRKFVFVDVAAANHDFGCVFGVSHRFPAFSIDL